jgi:hypothetical protein
MTARSGRRRDLTVFGAAVLAGLLTSPFAAIFTLVAGAILGLASWALSRRYPDSAARTVAIAAAGLVWGAAVYVMLAAVTALLQGGAGSGSGSG